MNFLKIRTSWSNAEFAVLKICLASAYLSIGAYFHSFFRNYYPVLGFVFLVSLIWTMSLWLNKMRKEKRQH